MIDYKKIVEECSCKPNQGCGAAATCMCALAEDMAYEIDRLRDALREVARCDFQEWARNALEKDADAQKQTLERIAQYDMQKIAIDALEEGKE
jgi:hypothetical protein